MRCVVAVVFTNTLLVLTTCVPAEAEFYVSEFMASNHLTLSDEDGDFPDWIEVFNAGPAAADLGGYYLTDDAANLVKWRLPATLVPSGGYLVVFASGKDRVISGAELHTNFKLRAAGEYLALVEPDGVSVAHAYAPEYPGQASDVSYGLTADLAAQRCFFDPTPGVPNDESRPCATVGDLVFSVDRGFYDAPFDVTITTTTVGAQIYYTLDGSEPTEQTGVLYTSPIRVAGTTLLRAAGFLAPLQPTAPMTHTYVFLDEVLAQTGADFPAAWNDYAMDSDVVNDPVYHDRLLEGLKSIPTLSVVGDVDDLFGSENGIYTHAGRHGIEWERPVSVEMIRADGGDEFQVNCGIRIQGGAGRAQNAKKSLRLAFKTIYGPAELNFPFFEDSPVKHFDKIRLRAGHNKSWASGSARATYVRDQWMRDTLNDMGSVNPHGMFVHLYLNGLYWGLYNAVEKPDESFAAAHFGGDKDDWDVIKAGALVHGSKDSWVAALGVARGGVEDPAAYDALAGLIDLGHFTNYIIANFYGGTWDWDKHNWFSARQNTPGSTFKFFSWDAEYTLDTINANRVGMHTYGKPTSLYAALRKNEEYRVFFGDRVHRFLFENGALTPDRGLARYMKRIHEIDTAIIGESARWGDTGRGTTLTRDREWLAEVQYHRLVFFRRRADIFLPQLRAVGLYPLIEAPRFNQHGGDFDPGFELSMSAPEGVVFYTDDGSDPRLPGGAVSPTAQPYAAPIALTGSVRIAARALVGTEWSALDEALFVAATPVRVTEIMYNPPVGSDLEFLELENIGATPRDLSGLAFSDGVRFVFPAYVLNPGQRVLVVRNRAAFEAQYGAGLPIAGEYSGKLDNVGDRLRLDDPDGNPIQDFTYDDVWFPSTDGGGYALVMRDSSVRKGSWNESSNWRAGTYVGGSPGASEVPLCGDGLDNDGDGFSDYPADPGCARIDQDLEDPECDDGIDNDGDGLVDANDPECAGPTGNKELIDSIDPFVCYSVKQTRGGPEFNKTSVVLDDPFDGARTFSVKAPKLLCVPASVWNGQVADPDTALQNYPIVADSSDPPYQPQKNYLVESLGPLLVDTSKPTSMLLPAAVDEVAPVAAPIDGDHAVDAYKCYRIKIPRDSPRYLPSGIRMQAADRFEDRRYGLRKPRTICTAAAMPGQGVKDPGGHLVCYRARRDRGQAKHESLPGVHTASDLGPAQFDTRDVREICLPARRP